MLQQSELNRNNNTNWIDLTTFTENKFEYQCCNSKRKKVSRLFTKSQKTLHLSWLHIILEEHLYSATFYTVFKNFWNTINIFIELSSNHQTIWLASIKCSNQTQNVSKISPVNLPILQHRQHEKNLRLNARQYLKFDKSNKNFPRDEVKAAINKDKSSKAIGLDDLLCCVEVIWRIRKNLPYQHHEFVSFLSYRLWTIWATETIITIIVCF